LMEKGNSLWYQHCKAQDKAVFRIRCSDRLECIVLKKKIAKWIVQEAGIARMSAVEALLPWTNQTLGNTFTSTGTRVGRTVREAAGPLGRAMQGAGQTVGGVLGGGVSTASGSDIGAASTTAHDTVKSASSGVRDASGGVVSNVGSVLSR